MNDTMTVLACLSMMSKPGVGPAKIRRLVTFLQREGFGLADAFDPEAAEAIHNAGLWPDPSTWTLPG